MAFLGKARKQDLVLLAEELGQKVSDKMTIIDLKNIIIGSKDYEEEFVRAQLSVILEERVERETEEKIARQLCYESELNELRLQIESIRSNVKRTSCAEDRKNTSSNYRISIGRAGEHMRETSPAVLMAEATIPVTTPIKEENGMDDLRVVYVKVKGEQEMANAVMDTGAQMPVVRPDVVEGQSIDNRGSIQITSAFGEHEMGEVKDSNMELNDLRHGVVPVSKNLVNDMLICSSDYEVLIENTQMIRNPAKLREPSKKEGIISSTDSKSVCSQEVVTDLLPETQSLLNVPNGDLVAVKINGSNVQTNGQGIKESKGEVVLTCGFKKGILYSNRRGQPPRPGRARSNEPGPEGQRGMGGKILTYMSYLGGKALGGSKLQTAGSFREYCRAPQYRSPSIKIVDFYLQTTPIGVTLGNRYISAEALPRPAANKQPPYACSGGRRQSRDTQIATIRPYLPQLQAI
ncbi:hypothetical protein TNCV_335751 [Trichonephila clavipes]|nr:hypothetical protein TNCV_335751 [Trichonephila clavipes]